MVASLHTADDGGEPPPPTEKVAAATRAAACGSAALSGCTGCSPAAAAAARPGRAAARHAASRHAAAQEVRFDRQLALCSFTLHTATQVGRMPTLPELTTCMPGGEAIPCAPLHCSTPPQGTRLCCAPRPCLPCRSRRCWPGPACPAGSASSACCPSLLPPPSTSFQRWRPWSTCGGGRGLWGSTESCSLPSRCSARREVRRCRPLPTPPAAASFMQLTTHGAAAARCATWAERTPVSVPARPLPATARGLPPVQFLNGLFVGCAAPPSRHTACA